jgi:hypothetical protein
MALSSSLDVVLENDNLAIFGPPTSIDIALDIGPKGDRGSRIFSGSASPTFTDAQFNTLFGVTPTYGDVYILTSGTTNYGSFYTYTSTPSENQWTASVRIYDLINVFLNTEGSFVLPSANGGTGTNNTGASLNLGLNAISILGSYPLTLNFSAATNITFPTSGTLATTGNLSQFASTTSAQLAGIISDETGSGALVFANNPALSGTPLSTTAAADTNTTQIATTEFVIGQASSTTPTALSTATIGTSTRYARADHVHPTTGIGLTSGNLTQFASTTATLLRTNVISETTGTGDLVFATSPSLVTPNIGTATGTSLSLTGSTLLLNSAEAGSPSSNASFKVERGTSPDVEIRWNESTDVWQFTNDGTTYTDIGSGGGEVKNTEDVIGISFFTMGA